MVETNKEKQQGSKKEDKEEEKQKEETSPESTGTSGSEESSQKSSSGTENTEEKKQEKASASGKETGEEKKKSPSSKGKKEDKKTESKVNAWNLQISTKQSVALCRFIKNKTIGDAIRDLQEVEKGRKPVPMKGEIAHQKGKGISSAKFPKKASGSFRKVLNSLRANAENDGLEDPVISVAKANLAHRPMTKFGRAQKKRTHLNLVAREFKQNKIKNKLEEKKAKK